jgi:hypothetical protein
MSDHIKQTIADLEKKVHEYEAHSLRIKTTINELCSMAQLPPRYNPADLKKGQGVGFVIRSDQFHARPLATIIREYLEMRKASDLGPATVEEIYEALAEGGYAFNTKTDAIARISLSNAINKNPIFYKLPNKKWGLMDWYPNAKKKVAASENDDGDEQEIGSAAVQEKREKREADERALAEHEAAIDGKP